MTIFWSCYEEEMLGKRHNAKDIIGKQKETTRPKIMWR